MSKKKGADKGLKLDKEKKKPRKVKPPKEKTKIETTAVEKVADGIVVHYRFDTGESGKITFGYPFTKTTIKAALKRRYKRHEQAEKLDLTKFEDMKIMEVK